MRLSVVITSKRQPRAKRSWATRRASELVHRTEGFLGVRWSSAQTKPEATSMAVYCQHVPLAPDSRPIEKQSIWTSSPGYETSIWRSGSGSRVIGSGGAA